MKEIRAETAITEEGKGSESNSNTAEHRLQNETGNAYKINIDPDTPGVASAILTPHCLA